MHNDEVIWTTINKGCSFKVSLINENFCRNQYNVTGLCNRMSCPLSNGYYGTVIEEEGECFLCLKTIERAHLPRKMWEKIKLSNNYQQALQQIDQHMKNIYKDHHVNRCKQRLTRLRQTIIRMRRQQIEPKAKLVTVNKKTERREAAREKKAEVAARLEISIEQELLNRLKQGVYGDVYNASQLEFDKVLAEKEALDESEGEEEEENDEVDEFLEDDIDLDDEEEEEEEEEEEGDGEGAEEWSSEDEDINIEDVGVEMEDEMEGDAGRPGLVEGGDASSDLEELETDNDEASEGIPAALGYEGSRGLPSSMKRSSASGSVSRGNRVTFALSEDGMGSPAAKGLHHPRSKPKVGRGRVGARLSPVASRRKGARIEIEYEYEGDTNLGASTN